MLMTTELQLVISTLDSQQRGLRKGDFNVEYDDDCCFHTFNIKLFPYFEKWVKHGLLELPVNSF
jgi:hypothetical protein